MVLQEVSRILQCGMLQKIGWTQGVRSENEQENKKRKIENVEEEGGVEETKGVSKDGLYS